MDAFIHRRKFVGVAASGLVGAALGGAAGQAAPVDSGSVKGGKVSFPNFSSASEVPMGAPGNPMAPEGRVGFAVVGLGRLAVNEILPAFGACKKAKLVALVSGSPEKANTLATQYGVKPGSVYAYEDFEKLKDNAEVQVVYIVLPNALHAEYTKRAAAAEKHVLCEKPMCTGSKEAQEMIDACAQAGKKLMIAYRCQYEPYNRSIIEAVRRKTLGPVGMIEAANLQNDANMGQWRLKKGLAGGGSLPDVGLYCLNGSRAVLGEEPYEVSATIFNPPGDARFAEVEDTVSFTLRFPSGAIANCSCSYGLHETRRLRVYGADESLYLENAFAYHGQELTRFRKEKEMDTVVRELHEPKNQFALEMDHMADCVQRNVRPHTPGEEGWQDHRVMEAIYESVGSGKPVRISPPHGATRGPDPVG